MALNGIRQHVHRFTRRYPLCRRFSPTNTALILLWFWVLRWGERAVFEEHMAACAWEGWETWPEGATPHRMALVADPQLVDPHTYPGRPWPLSDLTERYTDAYMARNFRLLNARLDPDSVVFLGDLFDGGREWAPAQRREPSEFQRALLRHKGVPEMDPRAAELKTFVPGENGRWNKWDEAQWRMDLERFSRIFWDPAQLYPRGGRKVIEAFSVPTEAEMVENGAPEGTWTHYATVGGKQRQIIATLPGNHDLGFGAGVQWAVRDRFQATFGQGNRVDVLGNHTFVSIDSPSLSARSQWPNADAAAVREQIARLEHIWKPTADFMDDLHDSAAAVVADHLHAYYPSTHHPKIRPHRVTEINDSSSRVSFGKGDVQLPVVLLSHVPLFRLADVGCGPLRERGNSLSLMYGYQFQNMLTNELSTEVVAKVEEAGEIVHAFSGDDHDYCEVIHGYNISPAGQSAKEGNAGVLTLREITVKSFSWAMGVRRPGFELVSLWNPVGPDGRTLNPPLQPTIQTHLCLLPDQLHTFITYALLLGLTFAVLLLRAVVLVLRNPIIADQSPPSRKSQLSAPLAAPNGTANGHAIRAAAKGRKRASSNSTSTDSRTAGNGPGSLGVQRSHNARTRSVSPAPFGAAAEKAIPLLSQREPDDDGSDEEERLGRFDGRGGSESESESSDDGMWKRRRRRRGRGGGKVWRVFVTFQSSLLFVGVWAGIWYYWLISHH